MESSQDKREPRLSGHLLAGGVMLAIMAGWTFVNHESAPMAVVAILAATAVLSALVGLMQLRGATSTVSGLLPFALAVVAGACGIWLASQYRYDAMGESLGLGLFAILAAFAGLDARSSGLSEDDRWETVLRLRPILGMGLIALGAVSLLSFFYFALIEKVGYAYAPELIALLFAGFILFFGGLYLLFSGDPPPPVSTIRLFLILLGSTLGMILALEAVARAFIWNRELFRSGVAAFTGPDAWMFWLVAYTFLAGLGLIFASLSLSISQIRSSPQMRQTAFGYTSVIFAILFIILLGFANLFISQKARYTYNWNQNRGLTTLNTASKNLLSSLTEPTTAYVLLSPNSPWFNDIRNFVGNCQAYSNKMSIVYVDPKNDFKELNKLATRFKELEPEPGSREPAAQGVLLVSGAIPGDPAQPVPHVFIPERRLFEFESKPGPGKATLIIKAESEIMKELAFLAKKGEKQKIYLLQDDGALDMNATEKNMRRSPSFDMSKLGANLLVSKLRKDNYDVLGVSFGVSPGKDAPKDITYLGSESAEKRIEIPEDCSLLLLPGPTLPIPRAGLDAIERYLDRGGKLIAATDVATDARFTAMNKTGLEDLLRKYGVNVTDQILHRWPAMEHQSILGPLFADPRVIVAEAPAKANTILAKELQGIPFRWWTVRAIRPGTSAKYRVEPLLVAQPRSWRVWADTDMAGLTDFERYLGDLRSGGFNKIFTPDPIPVAVTVTEGSGETAKPRMVVFGDAEFMSNLALAAPTFESNYDLIASSIEWMSERAFVGPRPKENPAFAFGPKADLPSMLWGPGWTMMILIVMVGGGVWLARRK